MTSTPESSEPERTSKFFAQEGYPSFTLEVAVEEGRTPKEIAALMREAYVNRAKKFWRDAYYHDRIGHTMAGNTDERRARNDERRAIGKTPRR